MEKLAGAALKEQRRARRWGIFFKLRGFAYLTMLVLLVLDWRGQDGLTSGKHTALVDVVGVIDPKGDASADRVTESLQNAFKNKNTQGVILRINSPGGSPVQAGIIYDEIRRLRGIYPNVPMYAVVEDICASGGYYIAAAADKIYVDKASIIGSIGVIMDGWGFTGTMEKLGVDRREKRRAGTFRRLRKRRFRRARGDQGRERPRLYEEAGLQRAFRQAIRGGDRRRPCQGPCAGVVQHSLRLPGAETRHDYSASSRNTVGRPSSCGASLRHAATGRIFTASVFRVRSAATHTSVAGARARSIVAKVRSLR